MRSARRGIYDPNRVIFLRKIIISLLLSAGAFAQSAKVDSLVQQGQAALDRGDFPQAVADFRLAQNLAPESLQAARGLVLSLLQFGNLRDAAQMGDAALRRWPEDAQLLHWQGLVFFKVGENARAQPLLEKSAKLDGNGYDIHFDLALVLLAQDQYGAAATELEKAIQLDATRALPHVLLGRAYQNTNRTLQAIEQFQTALRLDPKTPLGHYHLGFAYASLGRSQDAIAEYEKELKLGTVNAASLLPSWPLPA